jgi:hypothetical protein
MTLFELALAHYLYNKIESYDESLTNLLNDPENQNFDFRNDKQTIALLEWLNKWGCRNISKASYPTLCKKLPIWWNQNNLSHFKKDEASVSRIFNSLMNIIVSEDNERTVTFGPTAASKTLFIIDKDYFIPWDQEIRKKTKNSPDGKGYYNYLTNSKNELNELLIRLTESGIVWEKHKTLFQNYISDMKLIDEYNWITKTKKIKLDMDKCEFKKLYEILMKAV